MSHPRFQKVNGTHDIPYRVLMVSMDRCWHPGPPPCLNMLKPLVKQPVCRFSSKRRVRTHFPSGWPRTSPNLLLKSVTGRLDSWLGVLAENWFFAQVEAFAEEVGTENGALVGASYDERTESRLKRAHPICRLPAWGFLMSGL